MLHPAKSSGGPYASWPDFACRDSADIGIRRLKRLDPKFVANTGSPPQRLGGLLTPRMPSSIDFASKSSISRDPRCKAA